MKWYVVQLVSSGKFEDGYYGWDGSIHSEEQIYPEGGLPFLPNDDMNFIEVGEGEKPSVNEVWNLLVEMNKQETPSIPKF